MALKCIDWMSCQKYFVNTIRLSFVVSSTPSFTYFIQLDKYSSNSFGWEFVTWFPSGIFALSLLKENHNTNNGYDNSP